MCEWGTAKPWLWADETGHMWRTTGDISDAWVKNEKSKAWENGMLDILDMQVGLDSFAGPNHWNDPDMLEVGNGGMTTTEYQAHFSLWSIPGGAVDFRQRPVGHEQGHPVHPDQ